MRGLIGKKIGMTRIFNESGHVVPVTVVQAGPCIITQVKNTKKDGYEAVQVGYLNKEPKHTSKPLQGHFDKSGVRPKKVILEFEKVPGFDYKVGQSFHVGIFNQGDLVRVSGKSKGKVLLELLKGIILLGKKKLMALDILKEHLAQLVKLQTLLGCFQE